MKVHGEQSWRERQRQVVKGVIPLAPHLHPHCPMSPPTCDCEENKEHINVAGAFLDIWAHQKCHEGPKDEEDDIAELEKEGENMVRGCQTGKAEHGGSQSLPNWSAAIFQAVNQPRV